MERQGVAIGRKEWYRNWAKKNPEKIKEYQRRYREKKLKDKAEKK